MSRPIGPDLRVRDRNGYGVQWTGKTVNVDRRTHGIRRTYVDGCRCGKCRDAEAAYSRARYRARRGEKSTVVHQSSTDESTEESRPSTRNPQAVHGPITTLGFAQPHTEMER